MVYMLLSPTPASPSSRPPPPPAVDDRSPQEGLLLPPTSLPPPPTHTLGSSRPEPLSLEDSHRLKGGVGAFGAGRRPPAVADRSTADLPPLPPSLGSSRLDDGARSAGRKRSSSPGAGGGRRSPPPRSPSPEPLKRPRHGRSSLMNKPSAEEVVRRRPWSRSPDQPHFGYGSTACNVQDNTERGGLMSYKQFIQVLDDDVSPAEAEGSYQEYRTEYITTQKRAYFDLHKNEDWLKDKYHPTKLSSVIERRNELCKSAAKNLILDLQTGTLDIGPGLTAGLTTKSGNGNDATSEDDAYYDGKKRMHGRGPQKDIKMLSDAPKAHPVSMQYRRIQTDIDRTLALVKKLDSEKGIVGNILSTDYRPNVDKSHGQSTGPIVIVRVSNTIKGLEGAELLDTLLTYLWRVHGADYYGMSEMKYAKGFRHVRAENKSSSTSNNLDAAAWEKKLDSFWEERLMSGEDPLVVLTAKDKIDAETVEVLDHYVRKVRDENYVWTFGCGAKGCAKIFHAPEFVHKHLRLKHPDLVAVLTSRIEDDIYFQNYMSDPDAPGGIPIMQHLIPDTMTQRPDQHISVASGRWGSDAQPIPALLPSSLLIPVPGAGPLGPFVPAPPEIAMRTMQHGQPGPNAAQGRELAMLGIPMPLFPLDNRPLRSYEDLDAPAEEVVALDFRSF